MCAFASLTLLRRNPTVVPCLLAKDANRVPSGLAIEARPMLRLIFLPSVPIPSSCPRVPDLERIATVVTQEFANVPGIVRTQTLTAFRAYSKTDLQQAWDIGVE